jgi:SSS family solute:Na+ symporter
VFILLGGLSVTLLGLEKLAGPNGSIVDGFQEMLRNNRATAGPHAEAVTRHVTQLAGSSEATGYNRLSCFQSQTHPIIPLSSMLFAIFSVSIWYNVLNQFMIQRVLGARDMYHARMGIVFAGFLKLILPLAVVFPGLILFARHPEILFQSWDQVKPDADRGYVSMIRELVPAGFRGLFLAALFGAIQSTVSAALNSTGTIVTMDLFRRVRPAATERTLVRIGAMTTAAAILIAVVLAALIGRWQASLFEYIQTLYAFFAPPFAAVFLLGILWRRTNSRGALGAVAVGFTFGLGLKLFLHALQTTAWLPRLLGSETVARLKPITEWLGPYFNQATVSWILCMVVCIGVSLLSPPPRPEQVTDQLTFNWKKLNIFSNLGSHWYTSVVFWWAVFVATIIAALLTFSGLVFPVVQELVAI